jgi:hypothetical protein
VIYKYLVKKINGITGEDALIDQKTKKLSEIAFRSNVSQMKVQFHRHHRIFNGVIFENDKSR